MRADALLRAVHYAGHELHEVAPDVARLVASLSDSVLEPTARVAWAWANELVRMVHVDRGDDDELAPLNVEVELPPQLELGFGHGHHYANVSDPFFVVRSVGEDSVLCKKKKKEGNNKNNNVVRAGDAVLAVDGEDCATVAEFMERVQGKREMVWTVVRLKEVRNIFCFFVRVF